MQYELRPATLDDLDVLYAIHRDAMRDYVAATWGVWDEAFQAAFFRDHFDPVVRQAILCDGALAGFLDVDEDETAVHLRERRAGAELRTGQGAGSEIVRSLQSRGKPVRLQALKVNVARPPALRSARLRSESARPKRTSSWPGGHRSRRAS